MNPSSIMRPKNVIVSNGAFTVVDMYGPAGTPQHVLCLLAEVSRLRRQLKHNTDRWVSRSHLAF